MESRLEDKGHIFLLEGALARHVLKVVRMDVASDQAQTELLDATQFDPVRLENLRQMPVVAFLADHLAGGLQGDLDPVVAGLPQELALVLDSTHLGLSLPSEPSQFVRHSILRT